MAAWLELAVVSQIESAVLEDQVVDWALKAARVNERPMTFKELTGFGPTGQEHSEVSST